MAETSEFPLVTGHLSLDLVNTEVSRRGTRHNLLATPQDLMRWLDAVERAGGLKRESIPQWFGGGRERVEGEGYGESQGESGPQGHGELGERHGRGGQGHTPEEQAEIVLDVVLQLRGFLRAGFEVIADGGRPDTGWGEELERRVARAPVAYRVSGGVLVPVPVGSAADALASLVALDALQLLASGELTTLRRCANPDCVLLFLAENERRKWCSMRLCGNRAKVARHQARMVKP